MESDSSNVAVAVSFVSNNSRSAAGSASVLSNERHQISTESPLEKFSSDSPLGIACSGFSEAATLNGAVPCKADCLSLMRSVEDESNTGISVADCDVS